MKMANVTELQSTKATKKPVGAIKTNTVISRTPVERV
jgi:hypothetical protein